MRLGYGEGVSPSLHEDGSGEGSLEGAVPLPRKFLLKITKIVHFHGIYVISVGHFFVLL